MPDPIPSSCSEWRRRGILRRGSKRFKIKHKPAKSSNSSSSSSESNLVTLFSSTSLSKTSSRWSHKRKGNSNGSKLDHGKLKRSLGSSKSDYNWPDLPFEPVLRAGILIVVTSPTGDLSLGLCDGEKPGKVREGRKSSSEKMNGK